MSQGGRGSALHIEGVADAGRYAGGADAHGALVLGYGAYGLVEVQGARDLHLDESIRAIAEHKGTVGIATATVAPRISQTLDMQGRPTTSLRHGLNIVRTDNGECKKIIVK